MIATMAPKLQKFYEDYWPHEIIVDLVEMFLKKVRQKRYEIVKSLMTCKLKEGEYVCAHVQRIQ